MPASRSEFPPLVGRRVTLRPVLQLDYEFLYQVFTHQELNFLWRFRGSTPNPDGFMQALWQNVLVQFMIERRSNGSPVGLITCYDADLRNGYAHLAMVLLPESGRAILAHDANLLFVNYLFRGWNLRKLYGITGERNLRDFAAGIDRYYKIEGRLVDHEYYDGRYWDSYIMALYREDWQILIERRLHRITEPLLDSDVESTQQSADVRPLTTEKHRRVLDS
jgi:RimJ/RimL family protein N-acetyltransferase